MESIDNTCYPSLEDRVVFKSEPVNMFLEMQRDVIKTKHNDVIDNVKEKSGLLSLECEPVIKTEPEFDFAYDNENGSYDNENGSYDNENGYDFPYRIEDPVVIKAEIPQDEVQDSCSLNNCVVDKIKLEPSSSLEDDMASMKTEPEMIVPAKPFDASDIVMRSRPVKRREKSFQCYKCSLSFPFQKWLRLHQLKHSDERPFKCDKCDYSTRRKGSLKNHELKHSDEKPFKCDKCDYSSVRKGNLKMHQLKHLVEQPFKCDKCDYSTLLESLLESHKCKHQE